MDPTEHTDERQLIAAAFAGDQTAFARLVAPHQRGLATYCYLMLGTKNAAADAVRETLRRAWTGRYLGDQTAKTWLFGLATETCMESLATRQDE